MKYKYSFTLGEWLYYIFFALLTIGKGMGLGANSKILQLITIIAFIMLLIKLVITKYTKKEIIICIVLIAIGIMSCLSSGREGVLLTIITIIGLKKIPYRRVLYLAFIIRSFIFTALITLSLSGIIENVTINHWRDGVGIVSRYGLGYEHPNLLHTNLFILIILFIYIFYEKLNVICYISILVINWIIYSFSVSRTGLFAIILAVLITALLKRKLISKKIFYSICKMVIPLCVLFTILTSLGYDKFNIIKNLDRLLSGRIYYSSYFLQNYKWNGFGRSLSGDKNLLDNGYVVLIINYGIIIFGLYIFGYYKIIKKFIVHNMDKELLMIILFSIYGITEGYIPNIFMNLSLIFLSGVIFIENKFFSINNKDRNGG
ncbi:putative uncharacterized protein [Clostridium sp. CAG:221]|uniref:hypothetical protein n=1 Tax=Clostridium sp. CAG:221 TaxID=1262780 RepID=UPI000340DB33|nr:hypothetical protein [Clostridium sp. CAG:221]CDB16986.1 putative uncharacterized protein [Clostridium sp. CAG:221]